jgi:pyrrolidone-carboxylate peptidase
VEKYRPDVIINLGTGRHTIEVWGENKTDGADAKGVERHGEAAVEGGPQWLESTLPQEAIEKALERTEDAAAGGRIALRAGEGSREQRLAQAQKAQAEDEGNKYLCNYLNYRMLEATRGQGIMSGFFHVDDTTAPQEMEVVVEQAVIAKLRERGGG